MTCRRCDQDWPPTSRPHGRCSRGPSTHRGRPRRPITWRRPARPCATPSVNGGTALARWDEVVARARTLPGLHDLLRRPATWRTCALGERRVVTSVAGRRAATPCCSVTVSAVAPPAARDPGPRRGGARRTGRAGPSRRHGAGMGSARRSATSWSGAGTPSSRPCCALDWIDAPDGAEEPRRGGSGGADRAARLDAAPRCTRAPARSTRRDHRPRTVRLVRSPGASPGWREPSRRATDAAPAASAPWSAARPGSPTASAGPRPRRWTRWPATCSRRRRAA